MEKEQKADVKANWRNSAYGIGFEAYVVDVIADSGCYSAVAWR